MIGLNEDCLAIAHRLNGGLLLPGHHTRFKTTPGLKIYLVACASTSCMTCGNKCTNFQELLEISCCSCF